ncbi:TPA: glycosyltransferase [Candidatus Bathyarchaeota archaeon]|nr:glycosyltransferase [Candidatus Bathyarchaeota archaeon]
MVLSVSDRPFVSVVVPFRNASATIRDNLASLLSQAYPKESFEIILVDDASTDGSVELVKGAVERALKSGFQVRLIRHGERRGPAAARNSGVASSRGEIVAFTDVDCLHDRRWLTNLVDGLRNGDVGGVYGNTVPIGEGAIAVPIHVGLATAFKYATCNAAYRRDVLLKVGLFDERFREPFREDTDLALSVLESNWRIAYREDAVVRHPVRAQSLSAIIRRGLLYRYDSLLYKKHPRTMRRGVTKLVAPILGPFSVVGLLALPIVAPSILLACLLSLLHALLFLALVAAFYGLFFVTRGYKVVTFGKGRVSLPLRVRCLLALPIFLAVLLLARLYGSLKFGKLLM